VEGGRFELGVYSFFHFPLLLCCFNLRTQRVLLSHRPVGRQDLENFEGRI
jgi:hypothetical protein